MSKKTIYLLVKDDNGKVQGSSGKRFSIASDPEKATINHRTEAWTDNPDLVTNPACKDYLAKKAEAAAANEEKPPEEPGDDSQPPEEPDQEDAELTASE